MYGKRFDDHDGGNDDLNSCGGILTHGFYLIYVTIQMQKDSTQTSRKMYGHSK